MKRFTIAGNWKMNMTKENISSFVEDYRKIAPELKKNVTKIICPVYPLLNIAQENLKGFEITIGAQNVSEHDKGAFTGEVSASILRSILITYCIIGHSERRQFYQDTDELIKLKWQQLRAEGINPIICVGETLVEREGGTTYKVIEKQISTIFKGMDLKDNEDIMVAYEPVWAIGTGKTATPEMAQEVHDCIRKLLVEIYGDNANNIPILYGGSVNPSNIKDLLSMPQINGALIGGASLKGSDYAQMVKIAGEL